MVSTLIPVKVLREPELDNYTKNCVIQLGYFGTVTCVNNACNRYLALRKLIQRVKLNRMKSTFYTTQI